MVSIITDQSVLMNGMLTELEIAGGKEKGTGTKPREGY